MSRLMRRCARILTHAVLLSYVSCNVYIAVQLHPYEYIYYNRLIGGVTGADDRGYETDYWVTGYREGIVRLTAYLSARDGAEFPRRKYKILVSSASHIARQYFPHNLIEVTELSGAEVYLATTRARADQAYDGHLIVNVSRFGTSLVVAKLLPMNQKAANDASEK